MENGSRHELTRDFRRLGTTGAALAVLVLGWSGTAAAATGPVVSGPVVSGDCPATVSGEDGSPLTVDVGALLNADGTLAVGLGARSEAPVALPVADAVSELDLDDLGVASDAVEDLCGTGQDTVNAVTEPVQETLPGHQPENPETEDPPPGESDEDQPNSPGGTNPPTDEEDPAGGAGDPDGADDGGTTTGTPQGAGALVLADGWGGATEWDMPDAPGTGRDVAVPPPATVPPNDAGRGHVTDRASAADEADALDRLPLLVAVAAVAFVGTTLAQTWVRRRRSEV
ncbi:hypothetical protein [Saccharomonospora halophila]|uniref:hypothetical protein n=1 Tax=Saccharomonospora halophila TaxID=129922 RepID=UPI00036B2DFD|nr:hypothetical protein [Saccharomonospora halophila]